MMSATQRGLQIVAISAWTAARSRRVAPRARRACSSASRRRALARVWSRPRDCLACRFAEWVSSARRVTPQRGDRGVNEAQPGIAVRVDDAVVAGQDRQQAGVIRGRRPDEADARRLHDGMVVAAVLPGVINHGQRLDTGEQVPWRATNSSMTAGNWASGRSPG